jgi:hypothetical protein
MAAPPRHDGARAACVARHAYHAHPVPNGHHVREAQQTCMVEATLVVARACPMPPVEPFHAIRRALQPFPHHVYKFSRAGMPTLIDGKRSTIMIGLDDGLF